MSNLKNETIADIMAEIVGRDADCRQPVTDCHGLNAAAIREALEQIHELLSIGGKPDTSMCIRYEAAYQIAEEALSAPPRNCDVGTAKEQEKRYLALCDSNNCSSCPVRFKGKTDCVFTWSQMPYEEGDVK